MLLALAVVPRGAPPTPMSPAVPSERRTSGGNCKPAGAELVLSGGELAFGVPADCGACPVGVAGLVAGPDGCAPAGAGEPGGGCGGLAGGDPPNGLTSPIVAGGGPALGPR